MRKNLLRAASGDNTGYIGSLVSVNDTTNNTPTINSGLEIIESGDLLVLTLAGGDLNAGTITGTGTATEQFAAGGLVHLRVFTATGTGSETSVYYSNATHDYTVFYIDVYRGYSYNSNNGLDSGTGTSIDPPSVSSVAASTDICAIAAAWDSDGVSTSVPTGYTKLNESNLTATTKGPSSAVFIKEGGLGSPTEDPAAFSITNSDDYRVDTILLTKD